MSPLFVLLFLAQAVRRPAAPPNIEPPQPVLAWIYPAGAQRGTTVEILATGTSILPDTVLVTGPGVTGKVVDGKDPNKVRLSVTVAPDAPTGEREFRLLNDGGVSNRFRFLVGDLPEISEAEPNNEKSAPQKIASLPVVINGQILDSDRDCFRFPGKAGQALVLEVKARALLPFIADAVPGWFDAQLTVFDSAGRQIAFADDFRGLPDPVLFFHPPADGDYTVELRDVIYRGRGDFIYRLTIGALPYVTGIFPLGGQRGTVVPVEIRGVNLASTHTTVTVPADAPRKITVEGQPFAASDYKGVRASETPDPQRLHLPAVVDGRIVTPGASAWFVFTVKKADRLVLEAQARRLGSPMDTVLTLYDARKNQVAENDDWNDPLEAMLAHNSDSRILYTFPAAGDYFLRLRDIQGKGGEDYAYRLSIAPPRPDFTLRITPDNPRMGQGDTAAINVTLLRHDDFTGEVKLTVENLPPGFIASRAAIPTGQQEGRLTITAPPDFRPGVVAPVVTGAATIGNDPVVRKAQASEAMMQAFAYTHILPTKQLFLAVVPGTAYTLAPSVPEGKVLEVKPGTDTSITIKILRKENVRFGVTITAVRLANGLITTKSVFVAPEKSEGDITLTVSKDAKPGLHQDVIVSGLMRANNQSIVRYTRAIPVQIVAP